MKPGELSQQIQRFAFAKGKNAGKTDTEIASALMLVAASFLAKASDIPATEKNCLVIGQAMFDGADPAIGKILRNLRPIFIPTKGATL